MRSFVRTAVAAVACLASTIAVAQTAATPLPAGTTGHFAALLPDRSVLVAGGLTETGAALGDAYLFAADGSYAKAGTLASPRAFATATQLKDGRVVVIGGEDASGPLASIEIFELAPPGQIGGSFRASGATLLAPRTLHDAVLLSDGRVLIRNGYDANGSAAVADEVFDPGQGTVTPADPALEYATIFTDKAGYFPGDTVLAKGGRWNPGENVHLLFDADPMTIAPRVLTLTADGNGQLQGPNGEFLASLLVTPDDLGKFFTLQAVGATSAVSAVTYFTDAAHLTISAPTQTDAQGNTFTFAVPVTNDGDSNLNNVVAKLVSPPTGFTGASTLIDPLKSGTSGSLTLTVTVAAGTAPGLYSLSVNACDGKGNPTCSNTATITIDRRAVVTVTANNQTRAYGASNPAFTYAATGFSGADTFTTRPTCSSTATSTSGVGTYPIACSGAVVPAGYTLKYLDGTLSITKASQTITFGALPVGKKFGETPFDITASTDSKLLVSFTPDDPTKCTVGTGTLSNGTTTASLTIVGAGTCIVTASQAGDANYDAATSKTQALTIGKGTPNFTFDLSTLPAKKFGDDAFSVASYAKSTNSTGAITFALGAGSAGCSVTADGLITITGAAVDATFCKVEASLAESANHAAAGPISQQFHVAKASQTITFGALPVGKKYGDAPFDISASTDSKLRVTFTPDDPTKCTVGTGSLSNDTTTATVTIVGAGTCNVTASQDGNANYGAASSRTQALAIAKAPLTITATPGQTKVYGAADPDPYTYSMTGTLVSTDTLTGKLGRAAGENVGKYQLQLGTLTAGANYDLTFVPADFEITKRAVTVTADAKTKVYGDADPALTYTITSGTLAFSDAFTGALTRDAGESVAAYAIKQGTLALSDNYVLGFVGANLDITRRPVTVTADAKTKVYGDVDPALTYQITSGNLVNGDAFTGMLKRDAGEGVGAYAINQDSLALSSNYQLTYVGASLDITRRPVTVTADPKTKVYGDEDPPLTYKITSGTLAFSDGFAGVLTRAAGENVGAHEILKGSLALSSNYDLTYVGANLEVTRRPVAVTAAGKTKVYGDSDPALTYSITSGSLAFTDTFSGALTRAVGENVGAHAILQGTLALNGNYALEFVGANLDITRRPLTVTADARTKVYGDGDPALTYKITSGTLAFNDTFTGALTRAAGEDVGLHAILQGTLGLSDNYALAFVGANLDVTKRPVTVTAGAKTKVYGDADPSLTYQITSGSLAFSDAFTGALSRDAGENVGAYAVSQGTLALTSNYALTYIGSMLTITARPVTVTADGKTKILGATDPALTYQVTSGNVVSGDAFSGSLARDAGEGVGTYAIRQGSLTLGANYKLAYAGANLTITYALAGTACLGSAGHAILQPINADGTSVVKQGSTVPAKFRVCDAKGASVGTPGVVSSFRLVQILNAVLSTDVNELVVSTTPDTAFRWDPTDQQWIFNISTKNLSPNTTYSYLVALNDGSTIPFTFGTKK